MNRTQWEQAGYTLTENGTEGVYKKYTATAIQRPNVCPECGSPHIIKKNMGTRDVFDYDAENETPVRVTFMTQRYQCKDPECGITFPAASPPYPDNIRYTDELTSFIADEMFEDIDLTYSAVSKKYGISKGSISEILSKKVSAMDALFDTNAQCYRLYIRPFKYTRVQRCFVAGTDSNNKQFLLCMLPTYDAQSLRTRLEHKIKPTSGDVDVVFNDMDVDVVEMLHQVFTESQVAIIYDSIRYEINKYKKMGSDTDRFWSQRTDRLKTLADICNPDTVHERGWHLKEQLDMWWHALPEELCEQLSSLWKHINRLYGEIEASLDYSLNEMDYRRIENLILKLQARNVPFETLAARMMYFNNGLRFKNPSTSSGSPFGHGSMAMRNMISADPFRPKRLQSLAVDIDSMCEQLEGELRQKPPFSEQN